MSIGCQNHDISEWLAFTDKQISSMARDALFFWQQWKPIIETIIAQFPKKVESSNE